MSRLNSPVVTSRLALVLAAIALLVVVARPAKEAVPPPVAVASEGVTVGTTPDTGLVPGSGFVEVHSPDRSRSARFTAYQYGSTIQTFGPKSGVFEFFLGDTPARSPELSVRGNGNGQGARVQARDANDRFGIGMEARQTDNPYMGIIDTSSRAPGATLTIGNPEPDGSIVLSAGSPLTPRLRVARDGSIELLSDRIRFHGSRGSGLAGADPGALGDAASVGELADAVDALRKALLDHGLIRPRP